MTKKTGTIITIVVAVLNLCCSAACCAIGVAGIAGGLEDLVDVTQGVWIPIVCLAVLTWVVPLLLWLFLVRNKEDVADEV